MSCGNVTASAGEQLWRMIPYSCGGENGRSVSQRRPVALRYIKEAIYKGQRNDNGNKD